MSPSSNWSKFRTNCFKHLFLNYPWTSQCRTSIVFFRFWMTSYFFVSPTVGVKEMAYSYIHLCSFSWFEPSHCLVNPVCPWSFNTPHSHTHTCAHTARTHTHTHITTHWHLTLRVLFLEFCDAYLLSCTHIHTLMHTGTQRLAHTQTHTHTHTYHTILSFDLPYSALLKPVLT